jgi:hypothetical protein
MGGGPQKENWRFLQIDLGLAGVLGIMALSRLKPGLLVKYGAK